MQTPNHVTIDPSAIVGNNKTRNITRAIALAAALTVAAACSPNSGKSKSAHKARAAVTTTTLVPTTQAPETTTTTTSPEQNQETLRNKVQATAELFAQRVIDEYHKGKSRHNYIYDAKDGSNVNINVLYETGTLVAGEYGEYGLVAAVHRDANGNFDPSTVDNIAVFENVNVAGKEVAKNPGDRETLYAFMLMKDATTGDWNLHVEDQSDATNKATLNFDTSEPTGEKGLYSPLSVGFYDAMAGQASTMFDRAVAQTPVNYPPAIAK